MQTWFHHPPFSTLLFLPYFLAYFTTTFVTISPPLVDHGVISTRRGQHGDTNEGYVLSLVPLERGGVGLVGHGGEGQMVVLQYCQAVLWFLLLQIEHLPQGLQLLQLTEGLQDNQHNNQAQEEVDSYSDFIELSEPLVEGLPWYVISQSDGT